jgi:hypothetical protein
MAEVLNVKAKASINGEVTVGKHPLNYMLSLVTCIMKPNVKNSAI